MQTKVLLKAIHPVGEPHKGSDGKPLTPVQYNGYVATFVAQDFPADANVPPDYAHLSATVPFNLIVNAGSAKYLHLGGEYIMVLTPA